jgi:hypothetical protein
MQNSIVETKETQGLICNLSILTGLYGGCSNGVPPINFFQTEHKIQFRSRPMRLLGFSNHEKGGPRQEISN